MNTFMKIGNIFTGLILSSPLHGMLSKNTLLVHFTGRKSGKRYTTPTNYTQEENIIRITSQKDRVWWRNLKAKPVITVTVRGQKISGTAVVLETAEETAEGLAKYLRPASQMAKYFNVKQNPDGSFDQFDLLKAAENRIIVEVTLN